MYGSLVIKIEDTRETGDQNVRKIFYYASIVVHTIYNNRHSLNRHHQRYSAYRLPDSIRCCLHSSKVSLEEGTLFVV